MRRRVGRTHLRSVVDVGAGARWRAVTRKPALAFAVAILSLGALDVSAVSFASFVISERAQLDAAAVDDQGTRFEDLELFALVFHRAMDDDCDGAVRLETLANVLGVSLDDADAETMERVQEYDANLDERVSRSEVEQGLRLGIDRQIAISLLVDVDGDDALSLKEHALGFADPQGEKNPDGFTARQIASFEYLDLNGNETVEPAELRQRHQATFLVISWAQILGFHMSRIDLDRDGRVSREEFVAAFRESELGELSEEQEDWFRILAKDDGKTKAIDLGVFRIQLLQDRPVRSRMAMERPIRPLLVPACRSMTP